MSIVRVTTVQLPALIHGRSFADRQRRNRRTLLAALKQAGERGSDLVLFGEYANLCHRTQSDNLPEYVPDPVPGALTRAAGRYAKQFSMYVALPVFGVYRNVLSSYVVLIGRAGEIVGCYQKTHPTVDEQRKGIVKGEDIAVYRCDFGTIGFMTCMDIEYPEVAQVLMLRGADLILFPHVQGSWGEVDWEIRYRARAVDTGLYLVSSCYGFEEGEWKPGRMIGRSGFVGRDGLITGDLGRQIGQLTADLDLSRKRITHFFFDYCYDRTLAVRASRRPELYHDLVLERHTQEALTRLRTEKKVQPAHTG
jgi:predicted amidohydrolase